MPYRDAPAPSAPSSQPFRPPRTVRSTVAFRLILLLPLFPVVFLTLQALRNEEPLPWIWVLSWASIVGAWALWRRSLFKKGARALLESQALLNAGSYTAGGECCEQILDKYRGFGGIEAPALSNLSIAVYHRGELARALEMLDAVEKAGWCRPGSALRAVVMQNRALYHGILGNLPEAERAAREARSHMTGARAAATMLVHDAVLAARAGRFADVVALTGTSEASPRLQLKLLRVLRAWALTVTHGSAEDVRMLLDGAKPIARGELAYVAMHWPELRTFLVENGFSDAV